MQSIADCERVELCGNSEPADVIEDTPNYNQKFWNSSWLMVQIMVQIMTNQMMNNQNFMVHLIYNPNPVDFVCQIMAIRWIVWYPNVGDPHCCSSCCVWSLSARAAWPDGALLWENIHRWWLNRIPVFNDFVCVWILWKLYLLSAKLLCAKHDITKL
jgi:hypothetical protein